MDTVQLECYSWLCRQLGMGDGESTVMDVPLTGDRTVRSVLAYLASRSEAFSRLVYDAETDHIRDYVALVLNGRMVELVGGLEAQLRAGDRLLLIPGFSGG